MTRVISQVVEVCVFRFAENRPEYLLLRRAAEETIHTGIWQFVTGTIEDGEKGLGAALRELKEETGMTPERFWVVPYTNAFYDHRADAMTLIPFFAAQCAMGEVPRLSSEHTAFEWVGYKEARSRLVWPGQRNGLDVVHICIAGGEEASRLIAIPL